MNLSAHRIAQGCVNRLMALDQRFAAKTLAHHQCLEMVAAAGIITHFHRCSGQHGFDSLFDFLS